jgi:ParB-like chromosome segregation protein Spo0J
MRQVHAAFKQQEFVLPLENIVMQREITPNYRKSEIYLRIMASLEHVGLIEPVVVFPRNPGDYLLLDGHVRLDILKSKNIGEVRAIFATDDEAYTYNKRINFIPPVAQHFMILKALTNGISEERIAKALNLDVARIRRKRDLLDGICPEVVEIVRNKQVNEGIFAILKKMKPIRQIEAAEHMAASSTYSIKFAKALLLVTRPELLFEPPSSKKLEAGSKGARMLLEEETESLVKDLKAVEESYGTDILALTVILGYVERLCANVRIERHLVKYHPDLLNTLRSMTAELNAKKNHKTTSM